MKGKFLETLSSETVFSGKKIRVVKEALKTVGGEVIHETVKHPGAVAILAMTGDCKLLMERQYRHSVGRYLLEVPAGTLEAGEDPITCARRELLEETGYEVVGIKKLGAVYTAPGYSDEILHLFAATVRRAAKQALDEDEEIKVELVEPSRALNLLERDGVSDAKSVILIQMLMARPTLLGRRMGRASAP